MTFLKILNKALNTALFPLSFFIKMRYNEVTTTLYPIDTETTKN